MSKRALILGGTGMLGRAVAASWRRAGWPVLALSRGQADITDRARLLYWADAFRPEVVVNCAAFTRVDDCESERQLAFAVNGEGVGHVAAAAERAGAHLIQISSDYVFDGKGREPYGEDATTGPVSVYGASKLEGERQALAYGRSTVLRTSWLFGPGGPNFVLTIRRLLASGTNPLKVVDDQVGCPTYTPFLARAIRSIAPLGPQGVLHYRNRDPVSWHGFAVEIARAVAPGARVDPVATTEFPRPAPRPEYSVLAVERFETATGRVVEPWLYGLAAYLDGLGDSRS